jgi:hypothetical protein
MYQGAMDLIGFGVAGSDSAGAMTVSMIDSATSTAVTITAPAGVVAGDLLVLLDRATSIFSMPTLVTPTGFTSIVNTVGAAYDRMNMSYKIAVADDASATVTGMDGADYERKAMYVFRGSSVITTATPYDAAGEITSGDPADQVVNCSGGAVPLVVIAGYSCYAAAGSVDPRTFSTTKDGEIAPAGITDFYLAYKIYNSSPADTTVGMADEGSNNILQSCYISVS